MTLRTNESREREAATAGRVLAFFFLSYFIHSFVLTHSLVPNTHTRQSHTLTADKRRKYTLWTTSVTTTHQPPVTFSLLSLRLDRVRTAPHFSQVHPHCSLPNDIDPSLQMDTDMTTSGGCNLLIDLANVPAELQSGISAIASHAPQQNISLRGNDDLQDVEFHWLLR